MQAPIITLTTDWGTQDYFAGRLKGHLLSALPHARIIDITHQLPPFNPLGAVPFLRNACTAFPQGTIHLIDANSNSNSRFIVALCQGHYFVTTDSGILFPAFGQPCNKAVLLSPLPEALGPFVADTVMLPAVISLAQGTPLEQLGETISESLGSQTIYCQEQVNSPNSYSITITRVDRYGNACLGINRQEFERIRQGRSFSMKVCGDDRRITQLSRSYVPTPDGNQTILLEGCDGYLQVAMIHQNASKLLGLLAGSLVVVTFQ